MKTVNAYTNGDIFETLEEAEIFGVAGKVVVDGFYVGTADKMGEAALQKWKDA